MWDEIARLSAGEGLTILLTTHYLEEADRLASQLAIVERGRVVAAGSPDELKARLRGDAVHVELAVPGDPAQLDAVLRQVPEVREVSVTGTQLSARADDGATTLPALLIALERAGISVHGITAARPSLDDVYLRYAGRRFAEAEEPASAASQPAQNPSGGTR
jgi:ABC-2 type transport system ATP-binding protein